MGFESLPARQTTTPSSRRDRSSLASSRRGCRNRGLVFDNDAGGRSDVSRMPRDGSPRYGWSCLRGRPDRVRHEGASQQGRRPARRRTPEGEEGEGGDEMTIEVSAFRWVPRFAQGLVRDLRVRWALEEAGLPYEARLIGPEDQSSESYRALQPFGQVPAYREDGLDLFESGAIVLHVAERSEVLIPRDPVGRARAIAWMFAALNSVEPHVQHLAALILKGLHRWIDAQIAVERQQERAG